MRNRGPQGNRGQTGLTGVTGAVGAEGARGDRGPGVDTQAIDGLVKGVRTLVRTVLLVGAGILAFVVVRQVSLETLLQEQCMTTAKGRLETAQRLRQDARSWEAESRNWLQAAKARARDGDLDVARAYRANVVEHVATAALDRKNAARFEQRGKQPCPSVSIWP